jgi:hypothetical protein
MVHFLRSYLGSEVVPRGVWVGEEVEGCFRDGGFSKEETNETTEHLVEVLDSLMGCDFGNTYANQ